jgi:penicillin-binding protein 1A
MFNFFKLVIKIFGLLILLSSIVISILIYKAIDDLPSYEQLASYYPNSVNRIYSSDGLLIEEFGKEHRIFVPIENIPQTLINAFIAIEDNNFYYHQGIDFLGIFRAVISNVKNIVQHRRLEGGSTITQQVVKNLILTPERSLTRKIKEAILSYKISKTFTKNQIMEIYLNQIYLGESSYGVASASYHYFSKSIDELTLAEAACIAGLPKAPSRDNPVRNKVKALERRNYVLTRMYEEGYITKIQLEKTKIEPINLLRSKNSNNTVEGPYYAQIVKKQLEELLHPDLLEKGGLSIFTTMNSNYQKEVNEALKKTIRNFDKTFGSSSTIARIDITNWQQEIQRVENPKKLSDLVLAVVLHINENTLKIGLQDGAIIEIPIINIGYKITKSNITKILFKGDVVALEKINNKYYYAQIPKIDGAMIAIEPTSGYVLAEIGGYSFTNSQFDRATNAYRQIGSLIKTLIYHGAFEANIPPNKIFVDKRIEFKWHGEPWVPKNWYKGYDGEVTLRRAFERSINTVTVQIVQAIGIDKLREILKRFKIDKNPPRVLSIALGAIESTLEKVTAAYAVFANGGMDVNPIYIQFIQDRKGNIIYSQKDAECMNCSVSNLDLLDSPVIVEKNKKQITDPQSAYQTISLLEGATRNGTASKVSNLKIVAGGKTGTTNNSYDNWFIGVSPHIVVGTYVGYDVPKSLGKDVYGSTTALPMYMEFMEKVKDDFKDDQFQVPDNIHLINIDKNTGYLSDKQNSFKEVFKESQIESLKNKKIENPDSNKEEDHLEILEGLNNAQ